MSVTINVQKSISSSYVMYIASPPPTELREKKVLPRKEGSQPLPDGFFSFVLYTICFILSIQKYTNRKNRTERCGFCYLLFELSVGFYVFSARDEIIYRHAEILRHFHQHTQIWLSPACFVMRKCLAGYVKHICQLLLTHFIIFS